MKKKQTQSAITPQRIKKAFEILAEDQINELMNSFLHSEMQTFSKEYFITLLQQSVELAKFYQCIKLIEERLIAQEQGDEDSVKNYNGKYNTMKKQIHTSKQSLLGNIQRRLGQQKQGSTAEEKSIDAYQKMISLLSDYCKTNIEEEMRQIKRAIEELSPAKQVEFICQSIAKWHQATSQLELFDQNYLTKIQIFTSMFKQKEQPKQFQNINQTVEIKHVETQLTKYIEKSSILFKNAQFYNGIVQYLKKFVREMLSPLQQRKKQEKDILNIILDKQDIRNEFERLLDAYRQYIFQNDKNSATFLVESTQNREKEAQFKAKIEKLQENIKAQQALIANLKEKEKSLILEAEQNIVMLEKQHAEKNKDLGKKISATLKAFQQIKTDYFAQKNEWTQLLLKAQQLFTQQLTTSYSLIKQIEQRFTRKQQENKKLAKETKVLKEQLQFEQQKQKMLQNDTQKQILQMNNQTKLILQAQERAKKDLKQLKQNFKKIQQKLRKQKMLYFYQQFFNNQILYDRSEDKQYVYDTLYKRYQRKIKATKLIYQFDPFNKVNFHHYVDEVPNILVLMKLQNGRILVAYTPHPFEKDCRGDQAMLMVVNTRTNFYLKQGSRAISYDQYYLLFGNSEIRLRSGENLLFSNFGIANCYFQNNRTTVDVLLGQGKDVRQLPLESYEIYQVIFAE